MIRVVIKRAYKIYWASNFQSWFEEQTFKSQTQMADRFSKIECEGYFGEHKFLVDDIWELKWTNERRVYYAFLAESNIILLLGGNKNGQDKDITQAKKIFKKCQKQ